MHPARCSSVCPIRPFKRSFQGSKWEEEAIFTGHICFLLKVRVPLTLLGFCLDCFGGLLADCRLLACLKLYGRQSDPSARFRSTFALMMSKNWQQSGVIRLSNSTPECNKKQEEAK